MINQRNQRMRQQFKEKRRKLYKKIVTHVNAGVIMFSAGMALDQATAEKAIVHAQGAVSKFSPQDFIAKVGKSAARIAAENDLYASVMIAQAALESGWGNSGLAQAPNYNLFGIKGSFNGQSVTVDTLEDSGNGNYYPIKDAFKRYNSYDDSLLDYANTLTGVGSSWRANYYAGAKKSNTNSYQDATAHLTGRYATDTRYAGKLNNLISQYGLSQYDSPSSAPTPATPVEDTPQAGGGYAIQSGDSLYRIAQNHGVSLDELCAANGLSVDSTIHPNQQLVIPGSGSSATPVAGSDSTIDNENNVGSGSYAIQSGDSLYAIARRHGISVYDLASANGLTIDSTILPNQSLSIPAGKGSVADSGTEAPSADSTSASAYAVQAGEGLYRIAVNHGMTISELKELNGLTSDWIYPGQELKVSGNAQASSEESAQIAEAEAVESTEVADSNYQAEEATSETYTESVNPVQETGDYTETTTVEETATTGSYTVQAGETLYSIAQKTGQDVHQLIEKNGGANIYLGQVINY